MKTCKKCHVKIDNRSISKLCRKCLDKETLENRFQNWVDKGDLGIKVGTTLRGHLRTALLSYYGNNCSICKIDSWNNKKLNLILDHIDGNASNNYKENLRFVCPNCDSQLDTFKSKNKNSARSHRKKYTEVV